MSFFRGFTRTVVTLPPDPASAERVVHWKLDGDGTDAIGDVDLTLNGTPEVVEDSLLGDAEDSIGFDGADDYGTVADNAVFDLIQWSVVCTFQPDSAPSSGQRCIVGKGTSGDDEFQIEQRAPGLLRAYTNNGSTGVQFVGSSSGTATLTLDVAHQVALTCDGSTVRLWHRAAEGSWSQQASHEHPLALGRASGALFVAQSPYGGAFFDGVMKGVEIWDRALGSEQLDELAAPTTIDHAEPDPETNAPLVPSLTEWLVSDETTPSATKYVSNQNRGNGSGSSPENAQAVQAALSAASAGHNLIAICQTPGTIEFWNLPSGLSFPSGSAGNLITLQAREGDGVVISAAEDFSGARTAGSGFWTQSGLSQADIDKKIWKSVSTFSGGEQDMMGFWIEFDQPHQIIRADNMTNLRATYSTADSPTGYCGPSVHKDSTGTVYLRFQRPHPDKYSTDDKWSSATWPGHPEAVSGGHLVYPISENPNNYSIHLFRVSSNVTCFNPGSSGHHIKVGSGINSLGFRHAFRGSNAIQGGRGLHLTWRNFVEPSRSDDSTSKSDYYFNRMRCSSGSKIHLSRSEWKFGGWLEPIRDSVLEMFNSDTMSQFYFKDCTIGHYHEIAVGANRLNRIRFRNCTFSTIFDDGIQANQTINRIEMGYCYFLNSAYGGMGTNGTEGDATVSGEIFFHHNIVDYRQERGTNWRSQPHPGFMYLSHSPDGRSAWKIYNNIFIWGPDSEEEVGHGLMHCPTNTDNTLTGTSNMHEVFNNILLRVFLEGTKRYDATSSLGVSYSDQFQDRTDFVNGGGSDSIIRYSASTSNELFDYNLYWRSSGLTTDSLLKNYKRGKNTGSALSFSSLANWRAHAEFEHSKLSGTYRGAYSPGFDGNSTDTKPTIPAIDNFPADRFSYRPSSETQVTTATSGSLSGANWWSSPPSWGATYFSWNDDGEKTLAPSNFKGPLDPSGDTMPVGVQNP